MANGAYDASGLPNILGPRVDRFVHSQGASAATAVAIAVTSLLMLVLSQFALRSDGLSTHAAVLLGAGGAAWALALALGKFRVPATAPVVRSLAVPRPVVLVVALGLSAAAWATTGGGVYTRVNLPLWFAAIVAWCVAWWPHGTRVRPILRRPDRTAIWVGVGFAGVLAVAAFFCFHELAAVPSEPTSDHAEYLLDVHDVVRGIHPVFFPRNDGREPAVFYVAAALVRWFGQPLSWQTLKLADDLVGFTAVGAIFLFAREIAGSLAGLVAAALAAVAKWPLGGDRMGLRHPYANLGAAVSLWLLARYLRRGDPRDAILCGLALSLGLHGYTPCRVLYLAAPVFFGIAAVRSAWTRTGPRWWTPLGDGAIALGTSLVAAIPLLHYAQRHPDLFFYRTSTRLDGLGFFGSLRALPGALWTSLLAFNWHGDRGWTVSVVNQPLLDRITSAVLLAGVIALCYLLIVRRSPVALALVLITPILLLPSALSFAFPIENPSANRLGSAAPLVFLLAALPAPILREGTAALHARSRWRYAVACAVCAVAAVAFVFAARENYVAYFHTYRDQYAASAQNTTEVADALRARHANLDATFLVGYPYSVDSRLVSFALGSFDWYVYHGILPGDSIPQARRGVRTIYVLDARDVSDKAFLRHRYPRGRYVLVRSREPGKNFGLYIVQAIGGTASRRAP